MLKKAVQQGRSERRPEAYPLGYVEGLNDARTLLADCFSILLENTKANRHPRRLVEVTPVGLYYDQPFLRIAGHPTAFDCRSRCSARHRVFSGQETPPYYEPSSINN